MHGARAVPRSRWLLGALIFAALFWSIDLAVMRSGVPHPQDDCWEDHIVARNLIAGNGFRSEMIYAPLWSRRDHETLTIPVLVHGPLLPLLTVPVLAWLGPAALDGIAWAAAAGAWLTVFPLFRLVARRFGDPLGCVAAVLFTLSPLTLQAVHHSLSVVMGACLAAWSLDSLARDRPRAGRGGLLVGLAYLVRPEMMLAAPLLALFVARRGRWRDSLRVLSAFVACAAPWWWHQANAVSPWFNLSSYTLIGYWGDRPGVSVLADFTLTPERWPATLRAELPELPRKWMEFFPHAVKHVLFTPSGGTGWLMIPGLIAMLRSPETRRLAVIAMALSLIPVASMTLAIYQPLYIVPFLPLYAAAAAVGLRTLVKRMPPWARRPRAELGLTALLVLPSTLPSWREASLEARATESRLALERTALRRLAAPDTIAPPLFSDTGDFVAWTTGIPTVWAPREQFTQLYAPSRDSLRRHLGLPPRERARGWYHDDPRVRTSIGELVPP
jgi:hypothetical protein